LPYGTDKSAGNSFAKTTGKFNLLAGLLKISLIIPYFTDFSIILIPCVQ